MVTTTPTQNRYDHRLRELVRTTQDVSYALQCGVPPSTARGWLSAPNVQVVTLDSMEMDATQLQSEVQRLRARPVTTMCIACKEEQERRERQFLS